MPSPSQPNGPLGQQADKLLETQKLLRATLDASMDMIQVFQAVRNEQGHIIDFTWILNNHTSEKMYGDVVGKSLLQFQPGVVEEGIFDAFKHVVETGEPQHYEKHYVHEQFDGWFHQSVVKLNDGVATTTADITPRKTAEQQLQQSQTFLQSIIDNSLDVIQVFQAVRDAAGTIVDFTWILNNQPAIKQNGDVIGQSLLQHNPGVRETGLFDQFVQVTQTGISIDHQQYYSHEQFQQQWFDQTLVKMGDGFMMTTKDITDRKKAEEEMLRLKEAIAQRAEQKYAAIFNAINEGFSLLDIQFDAQGKACDVIIRDANPAQQRIDGLQALIGQRVRDVLPDIEPKWIERYGAIAQSGEAESFEDWSEANQRWYRVSASRVGAAGSSLVAIVYDDITVRKHHEQRKEFMLTLSDALRSLTHPAAIQAATTRLLRAHFDSARSYYMEIDEANHRAYMRAENRRDATPSAIGVYDLQLFDGVIATIRTGKPLIVNDWDERTKADMKIGRQGTDAMNQRQIVAQITAPIIKDGHLVATLTVNDNRPRTWTETDVELVVETAERTWAAVERAKAEAALLASEAEFRTITQAAPALVWVCSATGENIYFNARWYEYTGQTAEQARGHGWTTTMHPDDAALILPYWQQSQQTGEPYEGQVRYRRHDGQYRWHVFRALPRRDGTGQIQAWYGVSVDIDDARQAQQALELSDHRKDEFLAMLAHELRNPMSTIRSGLHILTLTDGKDETSRATIEMMNRQSDHLVRMVDDLLDVSRISQGKIELHKKRVDLVELARQAVDATRPLFAEQGRSLHLDLPTAPIYLEGDATRLGQVVTNLLTNGVRYTGEAGQVWLSLALSTGPAFRQEAILEVRDDGIGLSADQLLAIFELFVQGDNSTARSKGGLGLGLTLVKRLVELHGGRVEAQSGGIDQGSTFTVHLPTFDLPPEASAKPLDQPEPSANSGRILVIDDNADAAFTLAMLLKLKGYEAHTRNSGRAGIEAAQALKPAAILLDIGMPELDGYATCGLIRQQSWGQRVVVIALTGYGQAEDRQRTREAGFDGHLVKPVDLGELTKLLTDLFDQVPNNIGLA